MNVYISPYDKVHNNFLNITSNSELFEVYYKTDDGPLGFDVDETGRILFKKIAEGTVIYSDYNGEFYDSDVMANNRMIGFNCLFMFPNDYLNREIEKEKLLRKTIVRNTLLHRYDKPLLPQVGGFFTDLYMKKEMKFAPDKIDFMLSQNFDFTVGRLDSLGSHFTMLKKSFFMDRLLSSCRDLRIPIKRVSGTEFIPAW